MFQRACQFAPPQHIDPNRYRLVKLSARKLDLFRLVALRVRPDDRQQIGRQNAGLSTSSVDPSEGT